MSKNVYMEDKEGSFLLIAPEEESSFGLVNLFFIGEYDNEKGNLLHPVFEGAEKYVPELDFQNKIYLGKLKERRDIEVSSISHSSLEESMASFIAIFNTKKYDLEFSMDMKNSPDLLNKVKIAAGGILANSNEEGLVKINDLQKRIAVLKGRPAGS